jgi:CBS-domain-containing membrane protein
VQAASAEAAHAVLGRRLEGVRVADVMSTSPVAASADRSVAEFINEVVLHHPFSTYPLVDADGRLTGLVTLNRIRAVPADRRGSVALAEIACPPADVPTAHPAEALVALLPRMSGCTDGRAVVTDDSGRVIGVVSPRDISHTITRLDLRDSGPRPSRGGEINTSALRPGS